MPDTSFQRARRTPLRSGPYSGVPFEAAILDSGHKFSGADFFHYTTLENFRSICASRSLWMGRCLDTNDNEEVAFAVEVLDSHIRHHYAAHQSSQTALKVINDILSYVPPDIFFVSFTTHPDLLSQWRGYASDEGVSLGFSLKHIRSLSIAHGLKFGQVTYEYKKQISMIDIIARKVLEALCLDEKDSYSHKLFKEALQKFVAISPFIKHDAFAEEREWRLVYIPDGTPRLQPETRIVNGTQRRLVDLSLEPILFTPSFIFSSISTSPALSSIEGFGIVKKILADCNLSSSRMQMSGIPYQRSKFR